jgi:dihydrodipicolinate synthase/N-acetylneuraminate lyase
MAERAIPERVRPRRRITGMSAVLLPFEASGEIDWRAFAAHVERTAAAGLVPAVNMDTGYVQLLDRSTRERVLDMARQHCESFVAGACVQDGPDDAFAPDAYRREIETLQRRGAAPVIFPSWGLNALDGPAWLDAHAELARDCDGFIAFELGPMFVPYGRIYDLATYRGLLEIERCRGAKHSSLRREAEWQRLELRDAVRPDFRVLTGNDLAIDMVMYGSDYLLGLSTFAPDLFAARDRMWETGDASFYELNDRLQYLGCFSFRDPVPGYRHDAAMFLEIRGFVASDAVAAGAVRRPESDREVLAAIARDLGVLGS